MKTIEINSLSKRKYLSPAIECIRLDNEISLQLESPNADTEDEVYNMPQNFNNDPLKINLG